MISYIKGELTSYSEDRVVIENNGIGYEVFTSAYSVSELRNASKNGDVTAHIFMSVKDDGITLFGFYSKDEKQLFEKLISVNGVGPKAAISILGVLPPNTLLTAIISSDVQTLCRAPGIGKKTASRIVLELKDKLEFKTSDSFSSGDIGGVIPQALDTFGNSDASDAVDALCSLGYSRSEANTAVSRAMSDENCNTLERIISSALKALSKL